MAVWLSLWYPRRLTKRLVSLLDGQSGAKLMVSHALLRMKPLPTRPIAEYHEPCPVNFADGECCKCERAFRVTLARTIRVLSGLSKVSPKLVHLVSALQNIWSFGCASLFARLHSIEREANHVNLALRLDVLAALAVFAFVGAILLGVF